MQRSLPPLNALKAFEAAAQCLSFTQAATRLCVTQSAVSRQVKLLEEQLGVALFDRSGGQLRLTAAGNRLLPVLRQSFDRIAWTVGALEDQQQLSHLRINVPPTFASRWLVPRLGRLHALHPSLDLSITTRFEDDLLNHAEMDGVIRFGAGEWPELDAELLMQESHVAVCAPQLLEGRRGREVDLTRHTLLHVLRDDDRFQTWQHWLRAAGIEGVETDGGLAFDVLELAIQAAINGIGVAVADRHMIGRELMRGDLVQLLDVEVTGHQSYWLVTRQEQQDSTNMALFRRWLRQEISDPPA
ncbi:MULTISPECIES: transcriptional regulator GcvA [Halomonas]|uniref:Transcriptional regulator GcvA n=2 Tax=Halomonas TaxID=2745 RepID=A0AAU7KX86_9GAMM|nr:MULTISPECIES: transcriptional regulator GcvA [Halomonas]MBR9772287.1 transcriptional regulator GcvA [Gammaproteobacteria bacterium]KJZ18183.1 LysR family transcriptional regulator [Halomonas sp. S2151]MBY5941531.1 transcriptional regulator GcvA [Halomonas sp. DP5N14-9]MCO7216909.1 transcriptional regulator GcvA [Halomonas sp. OfavH-34-E]PTL93662.1 transcriptional regulator GcvA [Halomonas sp. SYSU XM8]